MTTELFTDLEAFVWLGFHRDTCTEFRVRLPRDKREARRTVMAVPCYNRFDPVEAWRIIDGYWDSLTGVELAREGSVALYFRVDADTTADVLRRDLRDEHADETSYDPETRVVRAWWD